MNYLRSISLFRPVILSVLICILITLSILKFFTISSAYATAISSKDSQVFIAVDITAQTRCLHKLIRYVGTSHQEIVVHSCSAGSILKSQITGLSQALAQHKKYVKLPTSQASRTTWEQTDRQIENLLENEAQKVQLPGASVQLSPQQRCGYSGSSYFQYTIDGDGPIGEEIDYYVSINCRNATLDTSRVYGGPSRSPNALWWDHDLYAGVRFDTGCQFIGTGNRSITITNNGTQPIGYQYQHWHKDNACSAFGGNFYYTNEPVNA